VHVAYSSSSPRSTAERNNHPDDSSNMPLGQISKNTSSAISKLGHSLFFLPYRFIRSHIILISIAYPSFSHTFANEITSIVVVVDFIIVIIIIIIIIIIIVIIISKPLCYTSSKNAIS
jgi:hypothetical protein